MQSQTRLHIPVTELNVATALWRRNAGNAHLAAFSMKEPLNHILIVNELF